MSEELVHQTVVKALNDTVQPKGLVWFHHILFLASYHGTHLL